ncbi:hypothetical protein R1X32_01055 (plasmid) [Rhodococcus opacus]|uniref:hypothetical protein n=1 Tax=Rhodococcus opacus TaxID=37919 RepID=UPI0034D15888
MFTVEGAAFDEVWTTVGIGLAVAGGVMAIVFGVLAHKLSSEGRKSVHVWPFIVGSLFVGVAFIFLFANMRTEIDWRDIGSGAYGAYCGSAVNSATVGYNQARNVDEVLTSAALNDICDKAKQHNRNIALVAGALSVVLLGTTAFQYRRAANRGDGGDTD